MWRVAGIGSGTPEPEVLQLMLDLRTGERPDVVMFYDGINDVASAVQRGVAGDPQNESRRVANSRLCSVPRRCAGISAA